MKNLEAFFINARNQLKLFDKGTPEYFEEVKKISKIVRNKILKYVMIRRTRNDVKEYFKKDIEKQKVQETKEIKFTPNIGDNDYSVKMRSAKRFLEEGNKVKFTLRFRGREMSYVDLGMEVLRRAKSELEDVAKVDQEPKMDGRQMAMMMSPK